MTEDVVERDLRRLQLLVTRAAADCGRLHPELRELDSLLHVERVEAARLRALLALVERPGPDDTERCECRIIRGNIAAELRDLLTGH